MQPDRLQAFIDDVDLVVRSTNDEHEITARLAERMSALLGLRLPASARGHATLTGAQHDIPPLHRSRRHLVHGIRRLGPRSADQHPFHETWGVVGIYAGVENEIRYLEPTASTPGAPLTPAGEARWTQGQVNICCTTDDDVHAVAALGSEPTIGIHVYGGNIATIRRRSYDPATGEAHWFVSDWDNPADVPRVIGNR